MPLDNQIPSCQSASLTFSCPLDLLLYWTERSPAFSFWKLGREGGRQAYLTPLCFLFPSLCSFPKEGTCIIYPFPTASTHLGTIAWCFTHFTVICGDWFAGPIISTWKIWKVYPTMLLSTPKSRKSLSVFPPYSTVGYTASVELMCLQISRGVSAAQCPALPLKSVIPVQEVVQNVFFSS